MSFFKGVRTQNKILREKFKQDIAMTNVASNSMKQLLYSNIIFNEIHHHNKEEIRACITILLIA